MKKTILALVMFLLLIGIIFTSAAENISFSAKEKDIVVYREGASSNLKVREVRQDPFPANPGEYTDLYIKIDNVGSALLDPEFKFMLKYPFSLDPSNKKENFLSIAAGEKITLPYRLRIDESALPGTYEVEFRAYVGKETYFPYYLDVKVDDITSSFDVALQEVSKEGVSLAISNIGKNSANSITVRTDSQEDFDLLGPSSHIIGNLNAGDYTLLNIFMAPKEDIADDLKELTLKLQIDYTDIIGNRRTVTKEIPTIMTPKIERGFNDLKNFVMYGDEGLQQNKSFGFFKYVSLVLLLAIIGLIFYYRKKKKDA